MPMWYDKKYYNEKYYGWKVARVVNISIFSRLIALYVDRDADIQWRLSWWPKSGASGITIDIISIIDIDVSRSPAAMLFVTSRRVGLQVMNAPLISAYFTPTSVRSVRIFARSVD